MSARRLWMIGAWSALALIAPIAAIAAEGGQLLATVDRPAILTATPAKALESTAAVGRARASLSTSPAISRRKKARCAPL